MDGQSLTSVLGLFRMARRYPPATTIPDFIGSIAGGELSPQATLQVASYLIEQTDQAVMVIQSSSLPTEAKDGILESLVVMQKAFSLTSIAGNISSIYSIAPSAVSNLVILLGAYQIGEMSDIPEEAFNLIKEIEESIELFDNAIIDPSVRDVAQRHMRILLCFLKSIPVIGLEPALAEYFALITKIRRADIGASKASDAAARPIWDKVKTWGERLSSLDKVINSGAKLIGHGEKISGLLDYLPDVDTL